MRSVSWLVIFLHDYQTKLDLGGIAFEGFQGSFGEGADKFRCLKENLCAKTNLRHGWVRDGRAAHSSKEQQATVAAD